jgi:hypothetical protein
MQKNLMTPSNKFFFLQNLVRYWGQQNKVTALIKEYYNSYTCSALFILE